MVSFFLHKTGHTKADKIVRRDMMGQSHRFRPGQKAPNNGEYVEVGETGSMVKDPQKITLQAGDVFPDVSNHNRQWTYKRKP